MTDDTLLKDFRTEYAKSGAAKCRVCEEKIAKVRSFPFNLIFGGRARCVFARRTMTTTEPSSMDRLTAGTMSPASQRTGRLQF